MGLVNLWILSGIRTFKDSKIDLNRLENKGIRYLNDKVTGIDIASKTHSGSIERRERELTIARSYIPLKR